MFISILIISYNHEIYISDAINSALSQTYHNFEIVISDDRSTDSSWKIITDFQRKHPNIIRGFRTDHNSGVVANTLHGINYCRGEFVCVFGSDDLLLPKKIELQVAKLMEDHKMLAVFTNGYKMSDHVCELLHKPNVALLMQSPPAQIFEYLVTHVNPIFTQSLLVHKQILLSAINHCKHGISDDWCYNAHIFSVLTSTSQFAYIDTPTFVYRFHPGGLHANVLRQVGSKLDFIQRYTPQEHKNKAVKNIYYDLIKDLVKKAEITFALRLWFKLFRIAPSVRLLFLLFRLPFIYSKGAHK